MIEHEKKSYLFNTLSEDVVDTVVIGKRSTVPRRHNPHNSIADWQHTEKQHGEE